MAFMAADDRDNLTLIIALLRDEGHIRYAVDKGSRLIQLTIVEKLQGDWKSQICCEKTNGYRFMRPDSNIDRRRLKRKQRAVVLLRGS